MSPARTDAQTPRRTSKFQTASRPQATFPNTGPCEGTPCRRRSRDRPKLQAVLDFIQRLRTAPDRRRQKYLAGLATMSDDERDEVARIVSGTLAPDEGFSRAIRRVGRARTRGPLAC